MNNIEKIVIENYLNSLLGRVFKILPLYEDISSRQYLFKYVQSLLYELNGLPDYFMKIKTSSEFIVIYSTLEIISEESLFDDDNVDFVKSEIFKCINIIKKITKNIGDYHEY